MGHALKHKVRMIYQSWCSSDWDARGHAHTAHWVKRRHLERGTLEQLDKEQLGKGDAHHGAVGKALPHEPAGPAVLLLARITLLHLRVEPVVATAARAQK